MTNPTTPAFLGTPNAGLGNMGLGEVASLQQQTAQANAYIKRIDRGLGQSRAAIKAVGIVGFGQAQARIKAISSVDGQAQARIKATYRVLGQAQAHIKTNYHVSAQAQGQIRQVLITSKFAQVQSLIGVSTDLYTAVDEVSPNETDWITGNGNAPYEAILKLGPINTPSWKRDHIVRWHHEASAAHLELWQGVTTFIANIISDGAPPSGFITNETYLTQPQIDAITDYDDLYIKISAIGPFRISWIEFQVPYGPLGNTKYVSGQAQARIKSTAVVVGQSQADIKARYTAIGQACAQIILATTQTGVLAQSNALIGVSTDLYIALDEEMPDDSDWVMPKFPFASYTAKLKLGPLSRPNWRTNHVLRYRSNTQGSNTLTLSLYEGITLIATATQIASSGYQTNEYRLTQGEMDAITNYGDLYVEIASTGRFYLSWVEFEVPYGPPSKEVFGQAQARVKSRPAAFGQSAASIKVKSVQYGQAQASMLATFVQRREVGQAQASIKATSRALGQAQAQIGRIYRAYGQAQAWIKTTYTAYAQTQARIRATTIVVGQAQGYIGSPFYQVVAQAQATVILRVPVVAQAQAIIRFNGGFANAQASIKKVISQHGLAVAYIAGTYLSAQDTFTRTTSNSLGTADIGGTWTLGSYNGTGLNTTGTEGTIYHGPVDEFVALPYADLRGSVEMYIKFKINRRPSGQGYIALGLSAYLPSTTNYQLQAGDLPGVGFTKNLNIQPNGTYFISGYYFTDPVIDANEYYWFKVRVEGSQNSSITYSKVWKDIDGEPAGWSNEQPYLSTYRGGHVGIWVHFDATTTLTIDNYNAYKVSPVRYAQAQAFIRNKVTNASGQAGAYISKTVASGQAQTAIKTKYNGLGQARTRIAKAGTALLYATYGQAQGKVAASDRKFAQANSFIYGQWFSYGQAQARIGTTLTFGQAQSSIKRGNYTAGGQARARIKRVLRNYGNAMATIKQTSSTGIAQANAQIRYIVVPHAQAQAQISTHKFGYGQALAMIGHFKFANAQAFIKAKTRSLGQAQAFVKDENGFLVIYNKYLLPGYAQSESATNVMRILAPDVPYQDGSLYETNGLENKDISLNMLVLSDTYREAKEVANMAGTMLRTIRSSEYGRLYLGRLDRYYLAMPKAVKISANAATDRRSIQYSVDFEAKPWAYSTSTTTINGTGNIDTGPRDFTEGTWTPTQIKVTGTDITVSGYTEFGQFTGFFSVSGYVANLVIDTETYSATINGINANNYMKNLNYEVYVGPGRTYFDVTGATTIELTWQNRW